MWRKLEQQTAQFRFLMKKVYYSGTPRLGILERGFSRHICGSRLSSGLDSVLARTTVRLLVRESGNPELSFWAKGTYTRPLTAAHWQQQRLSHPHPPTHLPFPPAPYRFSIKSGFGNCSSLQAAATHLQIIGSRLCTFLDSSTSTTFLGQTTTRWLVLFPLSPPSPSLSSSTLFSDPSTPVSKLSGRDIADPSCRLGEVSQDPSARNPVGPLPTAATSHLKATKPPLSSPHRPLPECHMRASGVRRF